MKTINIGLLGFGNVGSGVYKIISDLNEKLGMETGYKPNIKKILVSNLNKTRLNVDSSLFTDNVTEILEDDDISVVIELIGGLEQAREYINIALKNGKHVITGNKLAIAKTGNEFFEEAIKNNVLFLHEASVAGGIPIISGINEELIGNDIKKIAGIINGTTNYILTKMGKEGLSYTEAVKGAQDLGYAEADPTSDVEGDDPMYKIAILSTLAYNSNIKIEKIYKEGITKIEAIDFEEADKLGYTIKLLAVSEKNNSEISLRVHPALISKNSPLAGVNDAFNAVLVDCSNLGKTMFYGAGAGSLPTASAVVADLCKIMRENMDATRINSYKKNILAKRTTISQKKIDENIFKYYLRISGDFDEDLKGELSDIIEVANVCAEGNSTIVLTKKLKERDMKSILGKFQIMQLIRVEDI